jgi:hypothetical protein
MTVRELRARHLRAVPNEGESVNNFIAQQEATFRVITGWFEDAHELAACRRTLEKHIARARKCGLPEREARLQLALDSLRDGMESTT